MLMEILSCTLCAAGFLLIIWVLIGAFLYPYGDETGWIVLAVRDNAAHVEHQLRIFRYLRESGLLHARILLADCGVSQEGQNLIAALQHDDPMIVICPIQDVANWIKK
ncbi:MAG: hypothetical protein PHS97_02230 [Oscillospiraceae bacterium]|nr:hypothetical protein [Oscillospiraceae bacterium]